MHFKNKMEVIKNIIVSLLSLSITLLRFYLYPTSHASKQLTKPVSFLTYRVENIVLHQKTKMTKFPYLSEIKITSLFQLSIL